MNESEFSNNFQWFEWSFVSPDQFETDRAVAADEARGTYSFEPRYEVWDEDNRWTT